MSSVEELLKEAQEDAAHWRAHCKAVDAVCDDYNIPVHREDGSRIYTEDRVKLLIETVRADEADFRESCRDDHHDA